MLCCNTFLGEDFSISGHCLIQCKTSYPLMLSSKYFYQRAANTSLRVFWICFSWLYAFVCVLSSEPLQMLMLNGQQSTLPNHCHWKIKVWDITSLYYLRRSKDPGDFSVCTQLCFRWTSKPDLIPIPVCGTGKNTAVGHPKQNPHKSLSSRISTLPLHIWCCAEM